MRKQHFLWVVATALCSHMRSKVNLTSKKQGQVVTSRFIYALRFRACQLPHKIYFSTCGFFLFLFLFLCFACKILKFQDCSLRRQWILRNKILCFRQGNPLSIWNNRALRQVRRCLTPTKTVRDERATLVSFVPRPWIPPLTQIKALNRLRHRACLQPMTIAPPRSLQPSRPLAKSSLCLR